MKKKKVHFIHFNLGGGGAEKVLVSLLNHINKERFEISLSTVFSSGPHRRRLSQSIKYSSLLPFQFRGFTTIQRFFSPTFLYKLFIREKSDLEIAYLETSPTRIISGGRSKTTKRIAWVHTVFTTPGSTWRSLREMQNAYRQFDAIAFVSEQARNAFFKLTGLSPEEIPCHVVHNVIEHHKIVSLGKEFIPFTPSKESLNMVVVGKLTRNKGVFRLLESMQKFYAAGIQNWHLYFLGVGAEEDNIRTFCKKTDLKKKVSLLGYQENPYKYISKMDLFVSVSYSEGYSTAAQEALILGIPVFATNSGGMDEILENGKWGCLVENADEAIENGLRELLTNSSEISLLRAKAIERGKYFTKERLLKENEDFLTSILNK